MGRFGAGPKAGQGRADFRVTQGGPQTGSPRDHKGFQTPRDKNFGRVYAPDGKTPNTRVTGKRGEKGKETLSFMRGAPDKATASVPYYEVIESYTPAAESALSRDDIPLTYKKQVRDYFDALRPPAAPGKLAGGGR